jgi:acyl-CoA reductase-like NAD-dependent aldehyde dehydrogenase
MNKHGRKIVARIREALDAELTQLRELAEAERAAFENLPEGLQAAERGQALEASADTLDDLAERLDEVCSDLGALE